MLDEQESLKREEAALLAEIDIRDDWDHDDPELIRWGEATNARIAEIRSRLAELEGKNDR
jgi:hypothetical protein